MSKRVLVAVVMVLGVLVCLDGAARADVRLPKFFGEHMVLQREMAVPVWGWADPGEKVAVTLGDQTKEATADAKGRWSVKLEALAAGGPHVLKVQGKNAIELGDVLVGEVWLCSGQSNMQMTVGGVLNKEAEIAAAEFPGIRVLAVARKPADTPQEDCAGEWRVCSPKTVAGFSAAAYFFGRRLHQELGVPVGLIDSSWGGTPIQAWTSRKLQAAVPELAPIVENFEKAAAGYDPVAAQARYETQLAAWQEAVAKAKAEGKRPVAKAKAKGRPGAPGKPQPPADPRLSPHSPGTLYNGMIAPLAPYALRGAIWYQGESNAGNVANAGLYGLQMKSMIANWRGDWKEGDFAFLFVQLPNFMAPQKNPSETGGWPIIREQMVKTLAVANTGMAVTIDVGEANDIHPRNKQDVGKRLAQWALATTYGKDIPPCGPLYKAMRKDGDKIVLEFKYADGGLAARDGEKLKGFAIAGEDKKFVWAEATIEGETVVLSSPEVRSPAAVRYAWANNPECNLVSKAGLPASPFRTDEWAE